MSSSDRKPVREAAVDYLRRGLAVIPVPPGKKGPVLPNWNTLSISADQVDQYFPVASNIGVLLGNASRGLADIDCDAAEAVSAAPAFLPPTGMRHGRASKRSSHFFYRIDGHLPRSQKFEDVDGNCLLEIRADGLQTIIPPSVHPSGEPLEWEDTGEPATVSSEELTRAASVLAACALLARAWPAKGTRHDASLALAGFLFQDSAPQNDVEQFVSLVLKLAGDEESKKRLKNVVSTANRLQAGKSVTAGRRLAQLLGKEIVERAATWLGLDFSTTSHPRHSAANRASKLVQLADDFELFHTPDGDAYAAFEVNGHFETWSLKSTRLRHHLANLYYRVTKDAPNSQAVQDALAILESRARFEGPEHQVFVRVAEFQSRIYLDLATEGWEVAEIDERGWRILKETKVRFRRASGMLSLPYPTQADGIDEFRKLLNVTSDSDWQMIAAWLVASLRPTGPFPLLVLQGEQGTAKSTTARFLRALVDPSSAPLRAQPRDVRDLMIAARNSWILAYDNLSRIDEQLSDALCRLSTGGGFTTRELYTDAEEVLFQAQRPIMLNGIEDLPTRSDLLDRSMIVTLPRITPEMRKSERDLTDEFEAMRPSIVGGLLNAVSVAMRRLPGVTLSDLPRLADFAVWITAAEPALGWPDFSFVINYRTNIDSYGVLALESSLIAEPLLRFMAEKRTWEGTASDLLVELAFKSRQTAHRSWPSSPIGLANRLRRLAPNLRQLGVEIEFFKASDASRRRLIRLNVTDDFAQPASPDREIPF